MATLSLSNTTRVVNPPSTITVSNSFIGVYFTLGEHTYHAYESLGLFNVRCCDTNRGTFGMTREEYDALAAALPAAQSKEA